ncbi:MAG TPA: DUF5063 domain-containing protein [Bacteroidales bacterium]|nr:DUF5063 domain-containing protein [Bacteroidales bacterium]
MNSEAQPASADPVESRKVLEMVTVSNDFCLFLEKADDYSKQQILEYLQKVLPLIYLKASLLPVIRVEDEDATEHFVTEEQWEDLFNLLRGKLGEEDVYYFIDHHERSSTDAVKASLAENITDIYQDLKDFILLYQKPLRTFRENAVRDCRELFETRFGFRIVNSHAAIHYLLNREGEKADVSDLPDPL